jgi:hypothetical protein
LPARPLICAPLIIKHSLHSGKRHEKKRFDAQNMAKKESILSNISPKRADIAITSYL